MSGFWGSIYELAADQQTGSRERRANIGRCFTIPAAEDSVEMREIAEAGLVGDRTYGSLRKQWIAQHLMGARQTLVEQEPRERRSVALEQHLHVARRDAVAGCEAGERQFVTVQAVEDFRFDRMQARSAHAAAIRNRSSIARRAERKRDEIVEMSDHKAAQFGGRKALLVVEEADVARQQL